MSHTIYQAETIISLPLYSIPHIPNIGKVPASEFIESDIMDDPLVIEFKILLNDSHGVEIFRRFLESERAAHYLDFWFACQGFKVADSEKVYQLIKVIYRAYIRSESQNAVALQPNTKKNIVDKLSNKQCLDQSIFDTAQTEIRDVLIKEFYMRFTKSESFKLYQQNSTSSDNSKSENTEYPIQSINNTTNIYRDGEFSFVGFCPPGVASHVSAAAAAAAAKPKRDRPSNSNNGNSNNNPDLPPGKPIKAKQCTGGANKDRRSLAEADPVSFVNQLSMKLEKFRIMQQFGRSLQCDQKSMDLHVDLVKAMEDDPESILDNHCSFVMGKDNNKTDLTVADTRKKKDTDIRSVVSQDSGVATNFEPPWHGRPSYNQPLYNQPPFVTPGWFPVPRQYRHHHHHDHHHFRTRRRNRSEDQSIYSLEECTSNQVPPVARKGKSQASDASSIFDSGVSSTYEQISHPWMVSSDRVTSWVNNHPGIVNTPVELIGNMKRSCSAQTPGYKETITEGIESGPPKEVWIDACCMDGLSGPPLIQQEKSKGKGTAAAANTSNITTSNITTNTSTSTSKSKTAEANIVVGYYFCGDPVPYRTQVSCGEAGFTLAQFKMLLPRRGPYRYFFKRPCDEFDGGGAVQEEYTRNEDVLPLWEGKVVAKVEKMESLS